MQTQSVASTTKSNREYNEWGRCWQSARLVIKKVATSNSGRSGRRISFPRLKGSAMNKLLELKARKENFFFFSGLFKYLSSDTITSRETGSTHTPHLTEYSAGRQQKG